VKGQHVKVMRVIEVTRQRHKGHRVHGQYCEVSKECAEIKTQKTYKDFLHLTVDIEVNRSFM